MAKLYIGTAIARSFFSKALCFADTARVAPLTQTHALLCRYRKGCETSVKQNRT
ncbi:MAG: hypothetical protein LH660_13330 [Phormidesmis sp. CAN_BIN36]|nr:hypothetical protein [Phormidesmis sp. CAN_BIN36]